MKNHQKNMPRPRCLCWIFILSLLAVNPVLTYGETPQSNQADISVGTARFRVDLALTADQWRRGLMFRDTLAKDQGMLFVQRTARPVEFWMKNMSIPLDILYFDSAGILLEIHTEIPPCRLENTKTSPIEIEPTCPTIPSHQPVKYALEINAGRAKQLGLKPGDQLTIYPALFHQGHDQGRIRN